MDVAELLDHLVLMYLHMFPHCSVPEWTLLCLTVGTGNIPVSAATLLPNKALAHHHGWQAVLILMISMEQEVRELPHAFGLSVTLTKASLAPHLISEYIVQALLCQPVCGSMGCRQGKGS